MLDCQPGSPEYYMSAWVGHFLFQFATLFPQQSLSLLQAALFNATSAEAPDAAPRLSVKWLSTFQSHCRVYQFRSNVLACNLFSQLVNHFLLPVASPICVFSSLSNYHHVVPVPISFFVIKTLQDLLFCSPPHSTSHTYCFPTSWHIPTFSAYGLTSQRQMYFHIVLRQWNVLIKLISLNYCMLLWYD